jgi:hypothetical protein
MKDLPLARYASPLQLEPLRIRSLRATTENTVSTVGSVSEYEPWLRTASTGRFGAWPSYRRILVTEGIRRRFELAI